MEDPRTIVRTTPILVSKQNSLFPLICLSLLIVACSDSDLRLDLARSPMPQYPPIARQAAIEGTVDVKVEISPSGSVMSADAQTGHELLRDEALRVVRQWHFVRKSDQASGAIHQTLVFEFRIEGRSSSVPPRVIFHNPNRVTIIANPPEIVG